MLHCRWCQNGGVLEMGFAKRHGQQGKTSNSGRTGGVLVGVISGKVKFLVRLLPVGGGAWLGS